MATFIVSYRKGPDDPTCTNIAATLSSNAGTAGPACKRQHADAAMAAVLGR